jgi:hypothetical protein
VPRDGWQGSRYAETKNLDLKEVAKRIKKEVIAKYPGIGISVVSEYFANGCAIRIHVTRFSKPISQKGQYGQEYTAEAKQLLSDIQRIANQYRYDNSDIQFDHFDTNFYCTPQIEEKAYEKFLEKQKSGRTPKPQKARTAPAARLPKVERVERHNGIKPLPPGVVIRGS